MGYPLLSSNETKPLYFHNEKIGYRQAFIFCKHNSELYVMAKSIVKGVIEKDYPFLTDPYINKINKQLASDVIFYDIKDKDILKKVWDNCSGNFTKVTFVKLYALIPVIPVIFPELDEEALHSLRSQLHEMQNQEKLN